MVTKKTVEGMIQENYLRLSRELSQEREERVKESDEWKKTVSELGLELQATKKEKDALLKNEKDVKTFQKLVSELTQRVETLQKGKLAMEIESLVNWQSSIDEGRAAQEKLVNELLSSTESRQSAQNKVLKSMRERLAAMEELLKTRGERLKAMEELLDSQSSAVTDALRTQQKEVENALDELHHEDVDVLQEAKELLSSLRAQLKN